MKPINFESVIERLQDLINNEFNGRGQELIDYIKLEREDVTLLKEGSTAAYYKIISHLCLYAPKYLSWIAYGDEERLQGQVDVSQVPPKSLFHYCAINNNAYKLFTNKQLFINTYKNLNDPHEFEFLDPIRTSGDESFLYPSDICRIKGFILSSSPYKSPFFKFLEDDGKERGEKLDELLENLLNMDISGQSKINDFDPTSEVGVAFDAAIKERLSKVRVACFSEKSDNQLMWSHYADKMKGICIEFDAEKIRGACKGDDKLKKISYNEKNDKPRHDISKILNEDVEELIKPVTQKSVDWAYEKEWRFMSREKYLNIDASYIKSVVFGYMCEPSSATSLCSAIKAMGFNDVRFKVALPSASSYTVFTYDIEGNPIHEELTEIQENIDMTWHRKLVSTIGTVRMINNFANKLEETVNNFYTSSKN